jgi:hypothetical protein
MSEVKWKFSPIKWVVYPEGKDPFSDEMCTYVEVTDEGGGPFLLVSQYDSGEDTIRVGPEELEYINSIAAQLVKPFEHLKGVE